MATATKTAATGRAAGTASTAAAGRGAADGTKEKKGRKKDGKVKAAAAPARPGAGEPAKSSKPAKGDKAAKGAKAAKALAGGKAEKASKAGKSADADKPRKPKLVRDSFTIPKAEYLALDQLKQRAVRLGRPAKKSEVLRAGLMALAGMADAAFLASISAVPTVKTGRPAKSA